MGKFYTAFLTVVILISFSKITTAQSKNTSKSEAVPDMKVVSTAETFKVQKADTKFTPVINQPVYNAPQEKIFFDYNSMPTDVKNKVSSNKANGKPLLDGVLKGYSVEIAACKTETSTKELLSFLNDMKGFYKAVFISTGKVKLIVNPEVSSVDLKDKMLAAKLKFNFLEQFYLLK